MGAIKRRAATTFRRLGYDVRRVDSREEARWRASVQPVRERRFAQTCDDARALAEKYREPVFGEVRAFDLLERLALCIDVADEQMGLVNQMVHVLQMTDAMQADGIDDPDLIVAALFHDIGKLLLLVGEDPANVVGPTHFIAHGGPGAGFDRCTLRWGADDFAYARLVDHVPDHVAWLVRYHSIFPPECHAFMDDRDTRYAERYHALFQHYDGGSKSWSHLPSRGLEHYRDLVTEWFPEPIAF